MKQNANGQRGTLALRWVVGGAAVLLMGAIAVFILLGRMRMKNYLPGLEKRLGVHIVQETNHFTYDQSKGKRKIFTVRASKETQFDSGRIVLHDVGILLYDAQGEPADRIHGQEFDYDQKAQVLTAVGEVYIDLIESAHPNAPAPAPSSDAEARIVHVKTIGLRFDQKAQTADTDGRVEFRNQSFAGDAIGASYGSQSALLTLKTAVHMSGVRQNRPIALTASHALMDRAKQLLDLNDATYVSASDGGTQRFAAKHALIHTDRDGTPEHVDAEGNVTLSTDQRGTISGKRLQLDLNAAGQPRAAHLFEDVHYANQAEAKRQSGQTQDVRVAFDAAGRPTSVVAHGSVSFLEQAPAARRQLTAETVELTLSGGGKQPSVVRAAEASGANGAQLAIVEDRSEGRLSTELRAERLTGIFAPGSSKSELSGLDGKGHSLLVRSALTPQGTQLSKSTSKGDMLHLDFKPDPKGRATLARAEQKGNVAMVFESLAKSGPNKGQPVIEHRLADDAVYEADTNIVHMSGSVKLQDETSALFADRVDAEQNTGDATATGAVRVTYINPPAAGNASGNSTQEPMHISAVRAIAHKDSGLAQFFAAPGGRVRMWQAGSQVEAPVMDLYQKDKRLVAHGEPGNDTPSVRTVLPAKDPAEPSPSPPAKKTPSVPLRTLSREIVYSDAARTIDFSGGVKVVDADGTLTADHATVWLTKAEPSATATSATSPQMLAGKVDRMLATGAVKLDQPGREATGEKLAYSMQDALFILTGTAAAPPRVVDRAQGGGTTTGAMLRFHTGDDSVEVLGSTDGKGTGRVRSETQMKQTQTRQ